MNTALKISPRNLLEWSNMEDWVSGASAAPTDHTLSGASATVARESTIIKFGTYSAAVTRAGADATLYTDLSSYASYLGRQMTFGAWVYATVASRARLSIGDAVGTSNSSYHSGVAGWEYLTVTRDIDTTGTRIRCGMEVNTGNTTAYFDSGILVEGDTAFINLSDYCDIGDWKPGQRFRMSKHSVARRPGIIIPATEFSEKTFSISGKVFGSTPTVARTNFDTILDAMTSTEKDLYLYDDRFIRVFLESEDHEYNAALRVIEFNLKFVAQSPFFQYLQMYRSQQAISSSPTSFTVTHSGTAYSKPKVSFVAGGSDITTCTLENLTTGQTFSFTATVTAGNTLVIDCQENTVLNNAVDSIASFVGDFLKLTPGTNIMKFTGSNCTIKVDWSDRWA